MNVAWKKKRYGREGAKGAKGGMKGRQWLAICTVHIQLPRIYPYPKTYEATKFLNIVIESISNDDGRDTEWRPGYPNTRVRLGSPLPNE